MKVLTLPQPYAWGVTMGFVTRACTDGWSRHYGSLLIHAHAIEYPDEVDALLRSATAQTGADYALIRNSYRTLAATEAIVGAVTITDITMSLDSLGQPQALIATLEQPAHAINPVACPSRRGFFDVPADVIERLDIPGYVEM